MTDPEDLKVKDEDETEKSAFVAETLDTTRSDAPMLPTTTVSSIPPKPVLP